MKERPGRALAAGIALVGGVLLVLQFVLTVRARAAGVDLNAYALTNPVVGVGYLVPAVLLALHRPRNLLVLLLAAGAAGHLLAGTGVVGLALGAHVGWPGWLVGLCYQLTGIAWQLGLGSAFGLLLLLFPDGRLPSPRWRWLVWLVAVRFTAYLLVWFLAPDSPVANAAVELLDLAITAAAVVSLVLRYRRGGEQERGQILWLVLAVLVMVVLNLQRAVTGRGPELLLLSFVCVPVAIGIAVLRHQLLDIRLVVSRGLTYGLLVGLVLIGYVVLVAVATGVLPDDLSRWGPAASAIVVALALNPVRVALQRRVTRLFYGTRAEPAATAALLGRVADLDEALEHARAALRLPALTLRDAAGAVVAIAVGGHGAVTGRGEPAPAAAPDRLPLTSGGRALGTLEVTPRRGESGVHPSDARALAVLAGPLTLLLRERELTQALRASRDQVVRARESERSVLHRDLHDGLGPVLTNASLRADAAANLLQTDPAAAARLLQDVRVAVREAIGDVRRVVYGLRPLALEQLGLGGAVREAAARAGRLPVRVEVEPWAVELPPAVELAGYRIVSEAVANAQRHSSGTGVDVRLAVEAGHLVVTVQDDGQDDGQVDGRLTGTSVSGVGLRSIVERAEELGGRAVVGPGLHGWRVEARIPTDGLGTEVLRTDAPRPDPLRPDAPARPSPP